jgi:hypothetical protein
LTPLLHCDLTDVLWLQRIPRSTANIEFAAVQFCYVDTTASHETLESHYQLETRSWKLSGSWFTDTADLKASYIPGNL